MAYILTSTVVDEKSIFSINVYPNPVSNQLIIDNRQLIIHEVEISDVLGQNVLTRKQIPETFIRFQLMFQDLFREFIF
ncbi:MAG: hypothetical protein JJE25_07850 [Bacteroidia bacterium]|nr:hypothetical protein [Bacteroidia bacterium]